MRILMVGTFGFPEGGGGAARALHMQAKGLAYAGNDVLVATCSGNLEGENVELDGFKVKRFVSSKTKSAGVAASFFWLCSQISMLTYLLYVMFLGRFDSIIFYGAAPVFAVAALVGKLLKRHTCFVQGDLMESLDRKLLVKSEEILSRSVSLIIIGGSSLLEQHLKTIAPNTTCLRLWPPTDTDFYGSGNAVFARERLKVSGGNPLIVYAGAVSKLEGIDVLIESMIHVVDKYPEVKLVIAGPVLAHDPIVGAPLDYVKIVASFCLEDRVIFTGSIPMSEVPDLLAAATVLVNPKVDHPANWVAAPIKIGEYLSSGRPIITTRLCELGEWLVDRQDALFCSSGDPVALAIGICDILSDADLSEHLSHQGILKARLVCDYRSWGERITEAIEISSVSQ